MTGQKIKCPFAFLRLVLVIWSPSGNTGRGLSRFCQLPQWEFRHLSWTSWPRSGTATLWCVSVLSSLLRMQTWSPFICLCLWWALLHVLTPCPLPYPTRRSQSHSASWGALQVRALRKRLECSSEDHMAIPLSVRGGLFEVGILPYRLLSLLTFGVLVLMSTAEFLLCWVMFKEREAGYQEAFGSSTHSPRVLWVLLSL